MSKSRFLPGCLLFIILWAFLSLYPSSVWAGESIPITTNLLQGSAMDLSSDKRAVWQSSMTAEIIDPMSIALEHVERITVDKLGEKLLVPLSTEQITQLASHQESVLQGAGAPAYFFQGNRSGFSNANNASAVGAFLTNNAATIDFLNFPAVSSRGKIVIDNTQQVLTNKTISGLVNTLTNIPNAALLNPFIKILGENGISISTTDPISLGNTITLTNTGVRSLNDLTGAVTLAVDGINSISTQSGKLIISATESDTLSSVTGRGGTTSAILNLSNTANTITAGTLNATGGNLDGITIGNTTPASGSFTKVNGLTITNNGNNTLNIAAGKTLTLNNSITIAGTDGTTLTLPSLSDTLVTRSSTDTLTNKTIAAASNTITGLTTSNFTTSNISQWTNNTGFITSSTTDTLTNKTLTTPTINGTVATTGLTLPAFTSSGNIAGVGSPTISSFGSINGLTLSSSTIQPASSGSLTIQSNGANGLTIDTGGSGSIAVGNTNSTSISLGNTSTNPNITLTGSGTFSTTTGTNTLNGNTTIAANKNLSTTTGSGTITQNYTTTSAGSANTINATNNNTAGAGITVNGLTLNLTGNVPNSGTNTTNGINFGTIASVASNIFNGIIFPSSSNITNFLSTPSIAITGNGAISGATTINGLTLTSNATGFTIAGGTTSKTLQINKTLTLDAGADGQTFTFPSGSDTLAALGTTQTFSKPNTFSPGSNAGVALTVTSTTNTTPSNVANFTQSQGGADGIDINLTHTSGTTTNGLLVNLNGSGGTVTNGISINQSAGTLTNGLVLNGTVGNDITSTTTNKGLIIKTNGTGALNLDSGTTGGVSIGTGASAKTITIGNNTSGTALNLTANAASTWDVGNNTLSVQTASGGAITLGGTTTVATGKTLAVTDADKLTVGGKIIPQSLFIHVPLTATLVSQPVFIADSTYQVTGAKCVPTTLSVSGTFQVEVESGTTAIGSGTNQLTSSISLSGTANTVVSGTLIASPTTINAGDRVSTIMGGVLTGLVGTCTIYMKRV
jgi:hypothetical protein